MKYLSKDAAIANVRKFFSNSSEDTITLEEAYRAWERDLTQVEKNKGWFSNKMVDLKYNNLIKPIYTVRNNRRVLNKIQLTIEGKRALGRIDGVKEESNNVVMPTNDQNSTLSIADVMKIVAKLRKENPEYDIMFDVKLKNIA